MIHLFHKWEDFYLMGRPPETKATGVRRCAKCGRIDKRVFNHEVPALYPLWPMPKFRWEEQPTRILRRFAPTEGGD